MKVGSFHPSYPKGLTFSASEIKLAFRDDATTALRLARLILPDRKEEISKRQRRAWLEILRIMGSHSCEEPMEAFIKAIGDDQIADELLRSNVFSYHHKGARVGIQSRPMWLYLSAEIGSPGSPKRAALEKLLREDL